jgi:hypothetical protein
MPIEHLRKLMSVHQAAHAAHKAARDAMHTLFAKALDQIKADHGDSLQVLGHLGNLTKAAHAHKCSATTHHFAHEQFHRVVANGLDALEKVLAGGPESISPEETAAGGDVKELGVNTPGSVRRAFNGFELFKVLATQKRPVIDEETRKSLAAHGYRVVEPPKRTNPNVAKAARDTTVLTTTGQTRKVL